MVNKTSQYDYNFWKVVVATIPTNYSDLKILQKIDRHIYYLPDVVSSRCLKMILMFLYSANLHVCNNFKLFIAAYTTEKMRVWDSISEISGHM